ncbi:hypothetical protein CASFOL_000311 [Castilleja foliolosa]|uniref:Uncharacterized protein n=1 Tax=Castilleja foliolosa TaxID=1961234 RepID=A0ABD3ESB8_9LAMI
MKEPGSTYHEPRKKEDEEHFEAPKEPVIENERTPHEHCAEV